MSDPLHLGKLGYIRVLIQVAFGAAVFAATACVMWAIDCGSKPACAKGVMDTHGTEIVVGAMFVLIVLAVVVYFIKPPNP